MAIHLEFTQNSHNINTNSHQSLKRMPLSSAKAHWLGIWQYNALLLLLFRGLWVLLSLISHCSYHISLTNQYRITHKMASCLWIENVKYVIILKFLFRHQIQIHTKSTPNPHQFHTNFTPNSTYRCIRIKTRLHPPDNFLDYPNRTFNFDAYWTPNLIPLTLYTKFNLRNKK